MGGAEALVSCAFEASPQHQLHALRALRAISAAVSSLPADAAPRAAFETECLLHGVSFTTGSFHFRGFAYLANVEWWGPSVFLILLVSSLMQSRSCLLWSICCIVALPRRRAVVQWDVLLAHRCRSCNSERALPSTYLRWHRLQLPHSQSVRCLPRHIGVLPANISTRYASQRSALPVAGFKGLKSALGRVCSLAFLALVFLFTERAISYPYPYCTP